MGYHNLIQWGCNWDLFLKQSVEHVEPSNVWLTLNGTHDYQPWELDIRGCSIFRQIWRIWAYRPTMLGCVGFIWRFLTMFSACFFVCYKIGYTNLMCFGVACGTDSM